MIVNKPQVHINI